MSFQLTWVIDLDIVNPSMSVAIHHNSSLRMTAALATFVIQQEKQNLLEINREQTAIKKVIKVEKWKAQSGETKWLYETLPAELQRATEIRSEKGS